MGKMSKRDELREVLMDRAARRDYLAANALKALGSMYADPTAAIALQDVSKAHNRTATMSLAIQAYELADAMELVRMTRPM